MPPVFKFVIYLKMTFYDCWTHVLYLSEIRNVHDVKVNVVVSGLRQEAGSGLLPPGLVPAEHVHGAVPLGEGPGHAVADAGVGPRHAGDLAVHILPYHR